MTQYPALRLNKDQERRVLAGHEWIYSNEVNSTATPLTAFTAGQVIEIIAANGRWLGYGYVNPQALICARITGRVREHPLTLDGVIKRIENAFTLRQRLYAQPFYRLIYGESDALPGVVVDRYGEVLAVQLGTAGAEYQREWILTALEQVLHPRSIVLRNDAVNRTIEGLPQTVEWVRGSDPGHIELTEGAVRYQVQPGSGQKTGWFYDQAENRVQLARFGNTPRVLDVCCYLGGWGIQAAARGAESVLCVDSAATVLEQVINTAQLNGLAERVAVEQGDAFAVLRELRDRQRQFDLVILDPPAFIKRRKDAAEGTLAYQRLNQLGLQLTAPGGLLVTASCSYHLSRADLLRTIQQAARRVQRPVQLLQNSGQGPDHPVHPAMSETEYLKTLVLRVGAGDW